MYKIHGTNLPLGILFGVFMLAGTVFTAQDVTVTVHPGNDHVFKGFGVNHTTWTDPYRVQGLTQSLTDSILHIVFSPEEMGVEYLRLFAHPTKSWKGVVMDGDGLGQHYSSIYGNVSTIQPDIKFLWNPWSMNDTERGKPQDDLDGFVQRMVDYAKVMQENYGIDWTASGVFNEPQNDPDLIDDKHICDLVLKFRNEYDLQGMPDIKLIAPECSNVLNWDPPGPKGSHTAMIDSLMANPEAFAALDAIGYHSYDYGPAKWFRDKVRPGGNEIKEVWQTESALHGREGGEKEIHYAAQQAAIILSDINLLANRWFFFQDFHVESYWYDSTQGFYQEALNLFIITNREGEGIRVKSWLKTDYIGRLTRALKPNTEIRLCTSDLQPWYGNDIDRFTYMENTNRDISGESSQICAAAGRREDGSWVLAAVNRTGLPGIHQDTVFDGDGGVAWMKHTYAPADSFTVTFDVPELSENSDVSFSVTRCNMENRCREDGTVTMIDGRVAIPTAATELVTLESGDAIPITGAHRALRETGLPRGAQVRRLAGGLLHVSVPGARRDDRFHVEVYSTQGRLTRSFTSRIDDAETGVIAWDGRDESGAAVGAGLYHMRISGREMSAVVPLGIFK